MELRFKFSVLLSYIYLNLGEVGSASRTTTSKSVSPSFSLLTTALAESHPMTFSCIGRNGFYADPAHNCTHYFLCSPDGSRVKFQCVSGKTFDFKSQSCLEKSKVSCSTNDTTTTVINSAFTKRLRSSPEISELHSRTKSSGWLTTKDVAGISSSSNTSENMVTAASDNKEYFTKVQSRIGGIFSKKIPTKTVLSQSASNNVFVTDKPLETASDCSGRTGYFSDVSTHCNSYIYCDTTGKALRFQCPLDLVFDMQDLACVFPHKTKCGNDNVGLTDGLAPRQLLNGGFGSSGQGNSRQVPQGNQVIGGTYVPAGQNQFSNNGQQSSFQNNQQTLGTSFQQQQVSQSQQFPQQTGSPSYGGQSTAVNSPQNQAFTGAQLGLNQNQQQPSTQFTGSSQQGGATFLPTVAAAVYPNQGYNNQNQGSLNIPANNNQQQFSNNQNSAGFSASVNGFSNGPQQSFQNTQPSQSFQNTQPQQSFQNTQQGNQQLQQGNQQQQQGNQQLQQTNQQLQQANQQQQQQINQPQFPQINQPQQVNRAPLPYATLPGGAGYGGNPSPQPTPPVIRQPIQQPQILQPTVQPTPPQNSPTQYQSPQPSVGGSFGTSSYASPLPSQPVIQQSQSPRPSFSLSPTLQVTFPVQSTNGEYGNTGLTQSPQPQLPFQPRPSFPIQTPSPGVAQINTQTNQQTFPQQPGSFSSIPFTIPQTSYAVQGPSGGYGAPTPQSQVTQPAPFPQIISPPPVVQIPQPSPPQIFPQQPSQQPSPIIQNPVYSQSPVYSQPQQIQQPTYIQQTSSPQQPQVFPQPTPFPQQTFAPQPQNVQTPAQPQVPYAIQGPNSASGYAPALPVQNFNNQQPQISTNSFSNTQQAVLQQSGENNQPQFNQNGQTFPQVQSGGYPSGTFSSGGMTASDQAPGSDLSVIGDMPGRTPAVEGVALIKTVDSSNGQLNQDGFHSFGKKEVSVSQRLHEVPQVDASCNGRARGFYPLPGCQEYFYCSTFGERLNYSCQAGLLWNAGKGLCEDETLTICTNPTNRNSGDGLADDQPSSFDCAGKLGIFPDLRSGCRFFHRCAPNGQLETHQCAGSMIFNVGTGLCVDPNTFTCPTNITVQSTVMTQRTSNRLPPAAFSCAGLRAGRYANKVDLCRSFWVCDETGNPKLQICPTGNIFDETVQACDSPTKAKCELQHSTTPVQKAFDCRNQNGFFADVTNGCRSYYFCAQDGKSYKFVCPLNYQYSEVKEACDAPERTPCESHLSVAKNLIPNTASFAGDMAAQASDNFVTRTRFQPLSISSPKTVTNGWISVPETLTGRSTSHQDSAWTSFADNGQNFIVTSHLQSPRPKPNFPSSSPVVVQPVPHNPPTMHVINGFIVGSSPNGNSVHFDPSFRQQQPGLFHAPPPPLQGVAQTVIKNFPPPTDLRASVHRTISDEQFMSSLQQGQRPSSNSLFTIIPAGPPFPENILRPDPRLFITEQLRAFELGRQRNAQLVQFQERKLLQDRLNQLKNTFQPPGQFVHLTTDAQPIRKVSLSQKELFTRLPLNMQQDAPQRIFGPVTFPPADILSNQPGTECTLGVRGYFPDVSSDCRNYFFCDGRGHRLEHMCPVGMAFNTTLVACDLDMFLTCRKTDSLMSRSMATGLPVADRGNSCSGRKTGYYANFSYRCAKYFYCSMSGDQIGYDCPVDFFFDEFRGVCVEFGSCTPSFAHVEGAATTTQQLKEMGFALTGRFPRQFEQISDLATDIFGPALLGRRTEEFSFPCRETGHFADFDSGCSGFWACTDTVSMAKLIKCPTGQLFDPIKRHCVPAFMVQCLPPSEQRRFLGTVGFSCLGKSPTFHADMAENCRKFHHCTVEGEMLSYTCPFDWLYNENAGECVSPDNFTCPARQKSKHYDFDCVGKSGYYADFEHQCQFFHLCLLNGTRTTMACPTAMVFDENESKCVYGTICAPTPASADHLDISFGGSGSGEPPFQCPIGTTGFFGDPMFSCRTYWQCVDGARINNRSCPGLLRFNATTKTCEQARHVICADPLVLESLFPGLVNGNIVPRLQPFNSFNPFSIPGDSFKKFFDPSIPPFIQPPEPFMSSNGLLCEAGQIGFFAEPKSNCRTFYHCESDGVKKYFACPNNMLFDETTGRCQDETASVCGPRLFFQRGPLFPAGFEGVLEGVPVGICGGRIGIFADISSGCHSFFMCHPNGTLVNHSCPGALLFNEQTLMCDWPTHVRCGKPTVQSQNLLLGMPMGPRFTPLDPSGNAVFIPASMPGSLFRMPGSGEQIPDDPFSRTLTPFQLSPSELTSMNFPKYAAEGKNPEFASGSSNPFRLSPIDARIDTFGRVYPGVIESGLRLHPQLPVSLQSAVMGPYSPYGPRSKWQNPRSQTTTTGPTTTAGPTTTTGIPGMEEGEYEPEEGILPPVTTTALLTATTTPAAVVKLMPLMYDPLLGYSSNHLLSDAVRTKSKVPTSTMDPVKSFGVDCYGKKGYFLSPGTSCKSYVFCKPHGAIYSFTCPGEYLYNAEKEICDWPENVVCVSTSSHTAPKGTLRRWRRAAASYNISSDSVNSSYMPSDAVFVCPNVTGYFANQEDNCFSFFHCDEKQTAIKYECQDRNLRFDEARGVCEWSTRVQCGNGSLTDIISPSNDFRRNPENSSVASGLPHDCPFAGFFADFSSSCRNFSFCPTIEGPRLSFQCPEGLLYDDSRGKCQNTTAVTCTRQKQSRAYGAKVHLVTRTRLVTSHADSPVDCRKQRGLFADPKNHCATFFYCSPQGLKFEYSCPENMAFNNAVKACDDLSNSSCSSIP